MAAMFPPDDPEGPSDVPVVGDVLTLVRPTPVASAAGLLIGAAVVEILATVVSLLLPEGLLVEIRRELRSTVPSSQISTVVGLVVGVVVTIELLFTASLATAGLLVRNGRGWVRPLVILLAPAELTLVTTTGAAQPLSLVAAIAAAVLVLLPSSTAFFRAVKRGRRGGQTVLLMSFNDRSRGWRRWLRPTPPRQTGT